MKLIIIASMVFLLVVGFIVGRATLPTYNPADLNKDGKIDIVDWSIFDSLYFKK